MIASPTMTSGKIQKKVNQWWSAKESKNYSVADRLRAELRAEGIDPDEPYHSKGSGKGGGKGSSGGWGGGNGGGYGGGGTLGSLAAIMQAPMAVPMLQEWRHAKEAKNYKKADRIRESLRAQGINPDDMGDLMAGGKGGKGGSKGGSKGKGKSMPKAHIKNYPGTQSTDILSAGQNELLTQWFDAKDEHNYDVADGIRDRLRKDGIEAADCHRPGALDELSAEQLEDLTQWYEAKDKKNFGIADDIRDRMRAYGVNPTNCPRPGTDVMDEETKELLRQWNEAMTSKNFGIADGIRKTLRIKGVEPAQHSQRGGQKRGATGPVIDDETNAKLDEWDFAMKSKNYGQADQLRTELRAMGIEASTYRRPDGKKQRGQGQPVMDDETNAKLDDWDFAMKAKNFDHADTLRAELRAAGIEPSKYRRP